MRIGALAVESGRSVHTIRWYEAQGLLPGVTRDAGGRRIYREIHVRWLELMDRLRITGMSVAEMRAYTELAKRGRATIDERRRLLLSHRARVEKMIEEWGLALALIDSKLDFYAEWLATGQRPALGPAERVPALRANGHTPRGAGRKRTRKSR